MDSTPISLRRDQLQRVTLSDNSGDGVKVERRMVDGEPSVGIIGSFGASEVSAMKQIIRKQRDENKEGD